MPTHSPVEDGHRLFVFEGLHLIYAIKVRPESGQVVFVFSGIDEKPCAHRLSYYTLRDRLNATIVHVMDHFGTHGCYLLAIAEDDRVQRAVSALIRSVQEELRVASEKTHLIGTSKGATAAIVQGLRLGNGHVISGEPQIRIGDFIYDSDWTETEQWRSLTYTILGEVPSDGRSRLNELLEQTVSRHAQEFQGTITTIYGSGTGYLESHIQPLATIAEGARIRDRICLIREEFDDHLKVVEPFLALVMKRLGFPQDSSNRNSQPCQDLQERQL